MKISIKNATHEQWLNFNPALSGGEIGIETDTNLFKIGNGVDKWSDLGFAGEASGDFNKTSQPLLSSFTECRPLLIGGIPSAPGDPVPDQFEPPTTHTAFVIDEKRLVLNGASDPDTVGDLDASFGGIVLKGFRDHFWLYDYANNAWNTSDNINLSCETGIFIDNRKAIDEQKVRLGNRVKGGKVYLGSGEHDSWRIGTNDEGDLVVEYRRLDGQWVEKKKYPLNNTDKGVGLEEAENPYIERSNEPAKKPTVHTTTTNLGKMSWPLYEPHPGKNKVHVKLFLNTDDAFALGRIMKRTVNFNGVIPGPMIKVKAGDTLEVDFYNELDDLGEIEPWNDGMMQRHEMLHMHLDDRAYALDGTVDDKSTQAEKDANEQSLRDATLWMNHFSARGMTNLHTHGFHVRPDGFGDNVMRSVKPGSRLRYRYKLPDNHFGGLQWFHPHGHGGSTNLIGRGAIGTILIEGPYQERLNSNHVEREFIVLQRIQWGDNLNGQDELNWVDYVSNLQSADAAKDLSPYYKDNLDPKCICNCAAIGSAPHSHGTASLATPNCEAVDVRWLPAVNGQKRPIFIAQLGELKIFTMLNGTALTFFRIAVEGHDIVIVGRDGIPQVPVAALNTTPLDADFVQIPAGQRLNDVICNSGQRFEFFIIPKSGVPVQEVDYSINLLPIAEDEIYANDAPLQIAKLRYSGTLDKSAPNHVSKLESLLPDVAIDDPNHVSENAVFPVDRTNWKYIETFEQLTELVDGKTTATVTGASLTANGLKATIVMPEEKPHHLEVGAEIHINGAAYIIDSVDDTDLAQFDIALPNNQPGQLPNPGIVAFEYNLYKQSTINNASTGNQNLDIFEILTDHFYYRDIPLDTEKLKPYIARRRNMSFAIHKQGLAGSGSDSTFMNGSSFNDNKRTVGYLGTNEEIIVENRSEVIHLFHIHINYYQVMGYRDGVFGDNAVGNPVVKDNSAYNFANEISVPFQGFEDTTTVPVGKVVDNPQVKDEADVGSRGEIRVRISHEDFTGLFLMHCHLLDDQDMGMMQEVEVVAPGYKQAPFSNHLQMAG